MNDFTTAIANYKTQFIVIELLYHVSVQEEVNWFVGWTFEISKEGLIFLHE